MVDLLLVNPSDRKQYQDLSSSISGIEPPFWAGLIASFIRRHGYDVMIIDSNAENLGPEETADRVIEYNPILTAVIAQGSAPATSSTPKMAPAGEFLRALRQKAPELKTLLGGIHPSALPDRTLREEAVDFVCQGEGFYTILGLLYILKKENPNRGDDVAPPGLHVMAEHFNPRAPLLEESELPAIAWDLLPMEKYRAHNWHCLDNLEARSPYAVIYTSLGCPFNCHYCNIHQMYLGDKPSIRYRRPDDVIEEIDMLVIKYGVRNIKIMDELFTLKKEYVSQLCDLIIERGYELNIWAYGRVGLVDSEMLRKMKRAGVNWICYGFESASEVVRRGVNKKFGQSKMLRTIEDTYIAGLHIQANFMFGLPDDTLNTMQETLNMAKAWNFEWVNFYCNMAYPGSKLYDEAVQKGIKLPENWIDYGQYSEGFLPLPTKYVSAEEVLRFRDEAFEDYFRNTRYRWLIRRQFGDQAVNHIDQMLMHKLKRGSGSEQATSLSK